MKTVARLMGTTNAEHQFSMTATEIGGEGKTATITGQRRPRDGYLIADVTGPNMACKEIEIPIFHPTSGTADHLFARDVQGAASVSIPVPHWRSDGNELLPSVREALDQPFRAFPSWFLRVVCDRCGKERMFSETHAAQSDILIRDILDRLQHDGCGG